MADLSELLERVKAATGPDRELDCEIAIAVDGYFTLPPRWDGGPIGYGYVDADGTLIHPGHGGDQLVKRYTASIDAALALVERCLPEWWWLREDGHSIRLVGPDNGDCYPSSVGKHHLVPFAILSALLSALQSQAGK